MTQDEIAALIPANVVETLCEGLSYWDRQAVRASLAAGLAAWGGMDQYEAPFAIYEPAGVLHLILPIQEPTP